MRIIPLWLGLILNTFILYASQTPLHEACHGNIAGKDSRYLWLNHLVGYACGSILLHVHLAHHRDTNNEEIDPDHWVAVQGPFKVCSGITAISGGTSPSIRTCPACGRSPSTSA
jgi:fatty acid desaturase